MVIGGRKIFKPEWVVFEKHFRLENKLDEDLIPKSQPNRDDANSDRFQEVDLETSEADDTCVPAAASPAQMASITEEFAEAALSKYFKRPITDVCSDIDEDANENALETEISLEKAKKRKVSQFEVSEEDAKYDWESTKHFKEEWLDMMRVNHGSNMPVDQIAKRDDIKVWFRYKPNKDSPQNSTYGCRYCEDHISAAKISLNHQGPMCWKEGREVDSNPEMTKKIFSDTIKEHHMKL